MNAVLVAEWAGASVGLVATAVAIAGHGYALPVMAAGAVCFALALADTEKALNT